MVSGKIPQPDLIDMSADPVCVELNQVPETDWIVNNGDKLKNAFVYVKGGPLETLRFELPNAEVVLRHQKCRYLPHVLGLQVGQQLLVTNADQTIHNTHPTPKMNPEWNQTQVPKSDLVKKFMTGNTHSFQSNQPWKAMLEYWGIPSSA